MIFKSIKVKILFLVKISKKVKIKLDFIFDESYCVVIETNNTGEQNGTQTTR